MLFFCIYYILGLFPPSQGTAFINGYNSLHDIDKVRNSLGLCPQHNVVFDELTVEEHFYFACKVIFFSVFLKKTVESIGLN